MNQQILVGIGAGLTTALLYVSATAITLLSVALFYLVPLPVFLALLGWGTATGLIAGVVGIVAIALYGSMLGALVFAVTVVVPATILGYLALLSRQTPDGDTVWYPAGRLIVWASLISAALTVSVVTFTGLDHAQIETMVLPLVDNLLQPSLEIAERQELVARIAAQIARLLLPMVTALGALAMLFNLWLAGRILRYSDRLRRPWPDLHQIAVPGVLQLALAAAVLLAILPAPLGFIAEIVAAALALIFVLVGLSIVHALLPKTPARTMILGGIYLIIFFFQFLPLAILAGVGIADRFVRFRDRFGSGPGGPGGPPTGLNRHTNSNSQGT